MTKFYVEVTIKTHACKPSTSITAVYVDSIGEALDCAYDYLCSPYFGAIICVFDDEMNPLFTTEF
jgi:hypothetical protein